MAVDLEDLEGRGYLPETIRLVEDFFNRMRNDYDYVDTERFALESNPEEVAAYESIRKSGCCGSIDEKLQAPDGIVLVGFNHGH